jgi:hypothetical protein
MTAAEAAGPLLVRPAGSGIAVLGTVTSRSLSAAPGAWYKRLAILLGSR